MQHSECAGSTNFHYVGLDATSNLLDEKSFPVKALEGKKTVLTLPSFNSKDERLVSISKGSLKRFKVTSLVDAIPFSRTSSRTPSDKNVLEFSEI